jgi:N-acetylmuramoyl-L-alanine amidase
MIDSRYQSPNFNNRPENVIIDTIVLHFTEIKFEEAIARLCDKKSGVSSHYIVHRDGVIYQLVEGNKRAWHAGKSYWRGKEGINDSSIGIEIDNDGNEPYAKQQIKSVINLCKILMRNYSIDQRNVVGHSDIAPDRKVDPGKHFPWRRLHQEGIGIWPDFDINKYATAETQQKLKEFGYRIEETGIEDLQTKRVKKAFSDHFCQQR